MLFAAPAIAQMAQRPQWPGVPTPGFPSQTGMPPGGLSSDPAVQLQSMEMGFGMLPLMPLDNSRLINAESCRTWTAASVNSPTVSVARLEVPGKASHEFQKACGDFNDHRLESAEEHARKAVKIDPDYAAAWVVLGQVLKAEHKDREAIEACRNGMNADPKYAPPYICLAGFVARANDWDQVYSLANRALALDPATDPYAFLYTATADLHLKKYDQAELYGRSAEKLDKWHKIPEIHLLLAQIYELQKEQIKEAQELRKYLKNAPHDADWETAKTTLAELEDRPLK
jgi:tetratricopeptide (TPR) repeat protein